MVVVEKKEKRAHTKADPFPPQQQTNKRTMPFLFVRGDGVILVSPPLRE